LCVCVFFSLPYFDWFECVIDDMIDYEYPLFVVSSSAWLAGFLLSFFRSYGVSNRNCRFWFIFTSVYFYEPVYVFEEYLEKGMCVMKLEKNVL
jgi:hypothetical protein